MKLAKCEIEFSVPEGATKEMVESYLYEHLAGIHLEDGVLSSEKQSIEDTVFHNDEFDVNSVEIKDF